jgi:hypothetical protein
MMNRKKEGGKNRRIAVPGQPKEKLAKSCPSSPLSSLPPFLE